MAMYRQTNQAVPRSLEFAQFAIGLLWLLAARAGADSAAHGFARVLPWAPLFSLLQQIFFLILLVTGFTALHWVASRNGSVRDTNALRQRPTAFREWQKGAAVGWALLLVSLLPMAVVGDLHPRFWWAATAWGSALFSLLTLLVASLTMEVAYRGFLFQRLVASTGPIVATLLLSLLYAFLATSPVNNTVFSGFVAFAAGLVFCTAYLRTHALWLGWGIRFGWMASMAVLFGLPLAGTVEFGSVVTTESTGRLWLTGGAYGPEGSIFTGLILIAGALALFPVTRDYAWAYTQPVIQPAGFPMDVAPPAAHTAMQGNADQALVQIQGFTPLMASPRFEEGSYPDVDERGKES